MYNQSVSKLLFPINFIRKVIQLLLLGHEWEATINGRTGGTNCPYCSGRIVIQGENDLASTFPELLKEWNYEKNKIDPSEVSYGSNTRVWWKCNKGHSYQRIISSQVLQNGKCPICNLKK